GGNAKVTYAPGYLIPGKENKADINWQADSTRHIEEEKAAERAKEAQLSPEEREAKRAAEEELLRKSYLEEAVQLAATSDTVIFVGGLNHDYDVEGKDRADMKLPYGQDEVIEALLAANPDTIICMYAGSPVEMPWKDRAKTILWSYYNGMEGGTALAEVLFGRVNPSGKLAETMIKEAGQCPAHTIGTFGRTDAVEFKEGVLVGYRYYDTENTEVNFCFGHGLSYTTFDYKKLRAEVEPDGTVKVAVTVKNTGSRAGMETVQIYVAPQEKSVLVRPVHELKAFSKVTLPAGEEKELQFTLTERDFSCYDVEQKAFAVQPGRYEIQAAASSRDVRCTAEIQIK
ncbi:MAG: glycoside hydrolase family 3 C-terminal domain-containing protein, partial [Roseburia sp.]